MNDGRTCKEYHNENFGIRGWYRVSLIYDTKRICSEGRYPAGVDICYLEEHERLYEETASQGCVVSEYLPGTKARGYGFPRRNRLIAAMSDELIVIDAGRRSGTETTIKACELYWKKRNKKYELE